MKKSMIWIALSLFLTASQVMAFAETPAFNRHITGFERVIQGAETNVYCKYGIYSSRIIAVKHPEVYLQGDLISVNQICSTPGFAKAYTVGTDSTYLNLFGRQGRSEEKPFSTDGLSRKKII